ncbi:MAG: HAMP domain-containing histidine kinase [Rickettsiales bacterium]|nr:HAMP domain-containing histidine kinase [Rickettsiales bacterium]
MRQFVQVDFDFIDDNFSKMNNTQISQNTNRKNLLQLIWLRFFASFGQVVAILSVNFYLEITLPLSAMFAVLVMLNIINCVSFYRYKSQKNISDKNLFIELLFDVIALAAQLYLSGGSANPFISLFLLQVIIAAVLLQEIYAWLIAAITTFFYFILSFYSQESHAFHEQDHGNFLSLHLHGMLISYILSAILLLIFVTKINRNLKERDGELQEQQQIINIGLLASNAAHELSTPLSTIAVILNDLKNSKKDLVEDVEIMESQVERCKNILSEILIIGDKARAKEARIIKAKQAFDDLISEWIKTRNPQNLIYNFFGDEEKKIIFDDVLAKAFFNVFDNALQASPDFVEVNVTVKNNEIIVLVKDKGNGFEKNILKKIGQPNLTTKNSSGLGLFLTINALRKINSYLKAENLKEGAQVTITIPL